MSAPETWTQIPAADPMAPTPYRILMRKHETHDTFSIELAPSHDGLPPRFEPGQFNMLYVFGAGEVPISISGDPDQPDRMVHTTRAAGFVTRAMANLRRGDELGLRGPFGTSWPMREARGKDLLVVAGGIGLAPLRPVIYAALSRRDDFNRVTILYGTRTPDDVLFYDELKGWRARLDVDVEVTVDRAATRWRANVGVVTALIPRAAFEPDKTIAMVCGPEVMIRFTAQALRQRGLPTQHLYVSTERNMKCAVGHCGHCQFGPYFVCRDGPVFRYDVIERLLSIREL